MNITKKYNIKMKYDQFANNVDETFCDPEEEVLIESFEQACNDLKHLNKEKYYMMELGSNYAYYSMLFKKIISPEKTNNFLIEPFPKYFKSGKEHFQINNLEGKFLNEAIYNPVNLCNIDFDCIKMNLYDTILEHEIDFLDVLHCDIDGSELIALHQIEEYLEEKNINYLFLLTHPFFNKSGIRNSSIECIGYKDNYKVYNETLNNKCKEYMSNFDYDLLLEEEDVGNDTLLVYRRKTLI